jgi:hypothetical protein
LLASGILAPAERRALETQFLAIDPATLSAHVTRTLAVLSQLADTPARMMSSRVTQL